MENIPVGHSRGWKLFVNKKEIPDVESALLVNEKMGIEVPYGLTPAGYDCISIHTPGGGGSVIVPFSVHEGEVLIGMVFQNRFNQGGNVWNLPRGFLNPGETHIHAAKREFIEETGIDNEKFDFPVVHLNGPLNPDSAWFQTDKEGEGVKFFSVLIPSELLFRETDGTYKWTFGEDKAAKAEKRAEAIFKCRFFPWKDAMHVSDMFTCAGVGRLITYLCIGSKPLGVSGTLQMTR